MDVVSKYLKKYKALAPPEGLKKKTVLQTIQSECGIQLNEKQLRFSGNGLFINCHPTIRSELRMCAPRVLRVLVEQHNLRLAFIR